MASLDVMETELGASPHRPLSPGAVAPKLRAHPAQLLGRILISFRGECGVASCHVACSSLCLEDLRVASERDVLAQVILSVAPASPSPPHTDHEALPLLPESFLSKLFISVFAKAKCEEVT